MEAAALRAVDSHSALQQYVGMKMLNKVKDMQTAQVQTLLADFASTQQGIKPVPIPASLQVGANLDIKI